MYTQDQLKADITLDKCVCVYIYIYKSIFRQQVIIQANFIKDNGTLFIISNCNWVEDMGQFLYHLDPNTRKITRRLEKLQLKIINSFPSSLIKLAYISYIFNVCECVCVYI